MPAAPRAGSGAAAGAAAIGLYAVGALVAGTPPEFDSPSPEVAAYLERDRTRIQIGSAIQALWAPLLVWFLATVATAAGQAGAGARRAGLTAFGCGVAFLALFLADVTALTVAALRPRNMASVPEVATALHDFSWLAMGMASFLAVGLLAASAALALRHRAVWPAWVGGLAVAAAALYALRIGTLFTDDGPFAADGLLGLWVPVAALAAWVVVASAALARRPV